jgi:hypothetical protein
MIPQHFVDLAELPLTPNGKLDRKALPSPMQTAAQESGKEFPKSETEKAIADVWREVIGNVEVGRMDNFFDLGGHSLLAIQAIVKIERKTGWRPSPRLMILENLKEIAAQCIQAESGPDAVGSGFLSRLKELVRQSR